MGARLACFISLFYLTTFWLLTQLLLVSDVNCSIRGRRPHQNTGDGAQCKPGYILIRKPEGTKCIKDQRCRYSRCQSNKTSRSIPFTTTTPLTTMPPMVTTTASIDRISVTQVTATHPKPKCFGWGCIDNEYDDEVSYTRENAHEVTPPPSLNFSLPPIYVNENDLLLRTYERLRQRINIKAVLTPVNNSITPKEENCLKTHRVYLPREDQCYNLLQQGPCADGEWLVLQKNEDENVFQQDIPPITNRPGDLINIVCAKRPCPCRRGNPHLCEILITKTRIDCGLEKEVQECQVAMAAEQDGICDIGEQILLTPFGDGICGCQLKPPHITWPEDGKCYPLFELPEVCQQNQILIFNQAKNRPVCVANLCQPGYILYNDGRCYVMNSQGPCNNDSKLQIDPETRQLACVLEVKRRSLFNILPHAFPGIERLPAKDLTHLQATPADCNTIDGKCVTVEIEIDDPDVNDHTVTEQPFDLSCEDFICDIGYEPAPKPEGCKCMKSYRRSPRVSSTHLPITETSTDGRTRSSAQTNTLQLQAKEANLPYNLNEADEKAIRYLVWLHNFRNSRRIFKNKMMEIT